MKVKGGHPNTINPVEKNPVAVYRRVLRLWQRIGRAVPHLTERAALLSYIETCSNGNTYQGTKVFGQIRSIIDSEFGRLKNHQEDIPFLTAIFTFRFSDPGLASVRNRLNRLGEWSNTVHYMFAQALKTLGKMGPKAKVIISVRLKALKGLGYYEGGGISGPYMRLDDVAREALAQG